MYPVLPEVDELDSPLSPTPESQAADAKVEEDKIVQEVQEEAESDEDEDRLNRLLRDLIKEAEQEDEDVRHRLLREAKRNECYFNNLQKFYWDEVARDYRSLESVVHELSELEDVKLVNIYRPFIESLIAALSVSLPNVEFTPDDSENTDDIETAEAYTRISEIVAKHNLAPLMLIKAITIFFNQGTVFGYNYYKEDSAYGIIRSPAKVEKKEMPKADLFCPECGATLQSGIPGNERILPQDCPECQQQVIPESGNLRIDYEDEVVKWEDTPKGRARFDIFGLTNVKVPLYARNQESVGYLGLRLEDHVAKFKKVYSEYADRIGPEGGDAVLYERWARLPLEYHAGVMKNIVTLRTFWFRPWYFHNLTPEDAAFLEGRYPDGVMVSIIGDVIVEKQKEKLDDRWTISFDPRASYIHSEPIGNSLIPLADAETDIFNLGLQSIEYGIPETFANPRTLSFQKYKEQRAVPGLITPALPPGPDKNIADGFHTLQTATLSGEYTRFAQSLTEKQQFVSGAFPSVFGGEMPGSETATVYQESRARALQRLQLTWQVISVFWQRLLTKTVMDYAQNLREDEKFSKKEHGTYVNTWIRTSQLKGKVGHVEPELNQQLPQSWAQKKDLLLQLIQLQVPEIGSILLDPNNTEIVAKALGMPELYVPGQHDRDKQWAEYYELSKSAPMGNQPSVPIDVSVDDHIVHCRVLKNILVSPIGIQLYKESPESYQNCVLHYMNHELAIQAKTIAPSGNTQAGEPVETSPVADSTQG